MNLSTETEITDIYLHFTKTTSVSEKHMATFRTKRNANVQIIQTIYTKSLTKFGGEEIVLESSIILDNTASK